MKPNAFTFSLFGVRLSRALAAFAAFSALAVAIPAQVSLPPGIPAPPATIPPPLPAVVPAVPGAVPAAPVPVVPGVFDPAEPVTPAAPGAIPGPAFPPAASGPAFPPVAPDPAVPPPGPAPVDPSVPPAGPAAPGPAGVDTGMAAPGLLSDPAELSHIEGLDEPMERLKLRDQDGKMVLELIQMITGRHILRPQNLPQVQLNFDSFDVLTKRETLLALESLLAMNGIAITKIDNLFWKAVPALGVNAQVPIWLDGDARLVPPSQRIYVKMFHLNYAPATEVREQLNPFATPNVSSLLVFEKANSILVTDSLLNLQRMEKLLDTIDRPIRKEDLGTEFFVWDTQHAGARELETKLKAMIEGSLKPFLGGTTLVDSDERTGKLVVVTRTQNLETIQFILETLDAPVKMKTSSKLFKLMHAESKEIRTILDEVVKNQQRIKQQAQGRQSGARPTPASTNPKPPTPGAKPPAVATTTAGAEGSDGSHEFSDFITISADERSNSILVYGTKEDIEEIGRMIESLDHPLPLARIDTIFVMVDLSQEHMRGIDALFKDLKFDKDIEKRVLVPDDGPDRTPGTADDTESWTIQRSLGSGDEFRGKAMIPGLMSTIPFQMHNWKLTGIEWGQIFAQSASRNDVRIFSTPSLMVSHNAPDVHISIEDERSIIYPVWGGLQNNRNYDPNQDPNSATNMGAGRDMLSAKTQMQIKKPKIGLPAYDENGTLIKKGSIFMEVEVKAEKFDETEVNVYQGQKLPSKKNREAKTHVTVQDGEIIVIGGLQEVQMDMTEARYNFLSGIPYLGKKFFTPKTTKYTPTELLIFLRTTIINPEIDATPRNINNIDSRMESDYTPVFRSPSGKILSNTSGKVISRNEDYSDPDEPSALPVFND